MEEKQIRVERVTSSDYKEIMRYFYSLTNSSKFTVEKRLNDLYHTKAMGFKSKAKNVDVPSDDEEDIEDDEKDIEEDVKTATSGLFDVNDDYLYKTILNYLSLSTDENVKKSYLYYIFSHPKYAKKFEDISLNTETDMPEINKINKSINKEYIPKLVEIFKTNDEKIKQELSDICKEYIYPDDVDNFSNRIMTEIKNTTKIDFTGAYRKYRDKKGELIWNSKDLDKIRERINPLKKLFYNPQNKNTTKDNVKDLIGISYKDYLDNICEFNDKNNLGDVINDLESDE